MPQRPSYVFAIGWFSRIGGVVVALVGAIVLFGWIFNAAPLKNLATGLATMKANTALCFLACGTALWFVRSSARKIRWFVLPLAVMVTVFAAVTLAQDVFAVHFGVDEIIFLEPASAINPGRMSPATAVSFIFTGLALFGLATSSSHLYARSSWFALPPLFISSVALVGYAYDVKSLYTVSAYSAMAAHTAMSLFILSLSVMAANRTTGIARIMVSDTAGGTLARRLLPTIPLLLFGWGWLRLAGQNAGYYDTHFGLALMVVVSIAVCVTAVTWTAFRLHHVDVKRAKAETEILAVNQGLEQRVLERTQELEDSLAQVKQLSGMLPICAWCKNVRDDKDYWQTVEQYITGHTDAVFSHSICPDCLTNVTQKENPLTTAKTV